MRISGITIPDNKRLKVGLTVLYGIGLSLSKSILQKAKVSGEKKPTEITPEEENSIRKIIETETDAIIVASSGVFSTGINIKNLHNVVFTSPSKSRIKNLQSIGRVLRKSESKTAATLYDIADDLSYKAKQNYTIQHFKERIKIYSEEQFPYKIYPVSLKT